MPQEPVESAPVAEAPAAPEIPEAPAEPTIQTNSTGMVGTSLSMPEAPAMSGEPTIPAPFGVKTTGGERVIQPINDPTLAQNQEALQAQMEQILNEEGPKKDNPFNAPTPPPLNIPDSEAPAANSDAEGTQDFLDQTSDDFTTAIAEAPVSFEPPADYIETPIDNFDVQSFEENEVANAKAQMGLDNELIDEPSTEDANVAPIQPGYISDLTDQLSEEGGNTQSEIENPLAAAMARELADDPLTIKAQEQREQAAEEQNNPAKQETILDSSDSELPEFLRGNIDNGLGPNIQSSDMSQGEEAEGTIE